MADILETDQPAIDAVSDDADARADRLVRTPAPIHEPFVTFMRNDIRCEACRMLAEVGGTRRQERLHVVWSCDHLVVTEADDLSEPGTSVSARRVMDLPTATIFQLLRDPAPGASAALHKPAVGIAVMSWSKRMRRLVVLGVVEGALCGHEQIFDAVEEA